LSGNPAIAARMRIVDFSTAWTDTPVGVLIPFPIAKNYLTAIVKPFEWKVDTNKSILLISDYKLM